MSAPRWRCTAGGRRASRSPRGGKLAAGAAVVAMVTSVSAPVAAPLTSVPEPVAPLFGPNRLVATVDSGDVLGGDVILTIQELASGDLTGDGLDDIVVTRGRWSSPERFPLTILVNDGNSAFVDRTDELFEGPVTHTLGARRTLLADFNQDGQPDILIADTGVDAEPFAGGMNHLVLSTPAGTYVDVSANLPLGRGFFHAAAVGDVDADGDVDIFLGEIRAFHVLRNDGTGRFVEVPDAVPAEIAQAAGWVTSAAFVDVDGDRIDDLVTSSDDAPSFLFRNDGTGRFRELPGALPPRPFGGDAVGTVIRPLDVNGDTHGDLLMAFTKRDPFYQGRWIQVLVNRGDGTFRDETAARLPQADNQEAWSYDLVVADLDGDGDEDVAVDLGPSFGDPSATRAPPFFLNRGDGTFHEVETSAFADPPTPWAEPPHAQLRLLDADGDGRLDIFSAWQPPWGDPEEYLVAYQLGRLRDLALACPAPPPAGFVDVTPGATHAVAIDCVVAWGVARGTAPGRYGPAEFVTRAQMASFLARFVEALGLTLDPSPPNAFGDDDGSVHEPAIDRLAAAGIVRGVAPGRYAPGASVTRGQVASLLVRAYEAAAGGALRRGPDAFRDDDGNVHERSIDTAVEAGFATGRWRPAGWRGSLPPVRAFGAQAPVRRDQMATFLARALDRGVEDGLAAG